MSFTKFTCVFWMVLLMPVLALAQKPTSSEADLKKQADKNFLAGDFDAATPLYSQLLSLYPTDPLYNYRYGVCVLLAGTEKGNAIPYLETAAKSSSIGEEVHAYKGHAYMYAGRYQDALGSFEKFKKTAPSQKSKKLETDLLIRNCQNAIELQGTRKNVAIQNERSSGRANFYSYYDMQDAAGKLVPSAEQFLSMQDKDLQVNPLMFITKDSQTIYYSSFGKNSLGGKDIYIIRKMPNGQWSSPENLGAVVNSSEHEDFPYLDRDGRTLYFCSRGHNSIGGYDIFKTVYNFNTGEWSVPENLGISINTVADDFFYVPSLTGNTATYTTAFEAPRNQVKIRSVSIEDGSKQPAVISGTYYSVDQVTRRDARVSVLRASDKAVISSVRTDPRTGKYELILPPGNDYILLVEGGSYLPHAEHFSLPDQTVSGMRQEVRLNKNSSREEMTVLNYFTPVVDRTGQMLAGVKDTPSKVSTVSSDNAASAEQEMIEVRINESIVRVPDPKSAKSTVTAEVPFSTAIDDMQKSDSGDVSGSPSDARLATIKLKEKDRYNPELESAPTPEEIRQVKEEAERTRIIEDEEKKGFPEYKESISNAELAEIAREDARELEEEAERLAQAATNLKLEALQADSLAAEYEAEAASTAENTKRTELIERSRLMKENADVLRSQSLSYQEQAVQKRQESEQSYKDADVLHKGGKSATTLASGRQPGKQSETKSPALPSKSGEAPQVQSPADPSLSQNLKEPERIKDTESTELAAANQNENSSSRAEESSEVETKTKEKEVAAKSANDAVSTDDGTKKENAPPAAKQAINTTDQKIQSEPVPAYSVAATGSKPDDKNGRDDSTGSGNENKTQSNSSSGEQKASAKNQGAKDDLNARNLPPAELDETLSSLTEQPGAEKQPYDVVPKSESNSIVQNETVRSSETTPAQTAKATSSAEKNRSGGEVLKSDQLATDNLASTQVNSPVVIQPEAKKSYINYLQKINQSEKLAVQSEDLQQRIETMPDSPVRDSLITVSNTVSMESIRQWQDAQKDLKRARELDPQIESKVKSEPLALQAEPAQPNVTSTDPDLMKDPTLQGNSQEASALTIQKEKPSTGSDLAQNSTTDVVHSLEKPTKSGLHEKEMGLNDSKPKLNTVGETPKEIALSAGSAAETKEVKKKADQNLSSVSPQENTPATKGLEENQITQGSHQQSSGTIEKQLTGNKTSEGENSINRSVNSMQNSTAGADQLATGTENQKESKATVRAVTNKEAKQQADQGVESPIAKTSPPPAEKTKETASGTSTVDNPQRAAKEIASAGEKDNPETTQKDNLAISGPASSKSSNSESQLHTAQQKDNINTSSASGSANVQQLDTTHFLYPEYKAREEKVYQGQVETIETFAEAVNLNKLAVEQKQQQIDLLDAAQAETNEIRRDSMMLAAENLKSLSLKNEELAKQKFSASQQKTQVVKAIKAEQEQIRQDILASSAQPLRSAEAAKKASDTAVSSMGKSVSNSTQAYNKEQPSLSEVRESGAVRSAEIVTLTREEKETMKVTTFSNAQSGASFFAETITMNPSLPEGLVFKVQVGAFRKAVPESTFRGLTPVSGETTRPGWIRYCVGLFKTFEPANLVKKELRSSGYPDAFVVAYYNGVRMSLQEAYALLNKDPEANRLAYVAESRKELAYLESLRITPSKFPAVENDPDVLQFYGSVHNAENAIGAISADKVEFSVQIGVYRSVRYPSLLSALEPVYTESLPRGLFRFTSGRYDLFLSADSAKRQAVRVGVPDAFVVAYKGGKRIALPAARALVGSSAANVTTAKVPVSSSPVSPVENISDRNTPPATSATPLVSPSEATSVPKVRMIEFRVQIGAFRQNVPFEVVEALLRISDKGIHRETDERGLHIFYAGKFSDYNEALELKKVVVENGIKDAFVVAIENGKRISVQDALKAGE